MSASCGFLEDELRQCSKEGAVTMADSVETLGVDLRTRVSSFRERKKKQEGSSAMFGFPEEPHEGTSKDVGSSCSGDSPNRKILI